MGSGNNSFGVAVRFSKPHLKAEGRVKDNVLSLRLGNNFRIDFKQVLWKGIGNILWFCGKRRGGVDLRSKNLNFGKFKKQKYQDIVRSNKGKSIKHTSRCKTRVSWLRSTQHISQTMREL